MTLTDRSRIERLKRCPRLRYYEYEALGTGLQLGSAVPLDVGSCFHAAAEALLRPVLPMMTAIPMNCDWPKAFPLVVALDGAHDDEACARLGDSDRAVVDALVRTWWAVGLPQLAGWRVLEVEREEVFDYLVPCSVEGDQCDIDVSDPNYAHHRERVRMMSRLDLLTEAVEGTTLNGRPVAPGEYIWNWKTTRQIDEWFKKKWPYDAQVVTELLGVEQRLGHPVQGVVVMGIQKEDNPLLGGWRSTQDPTLVQARRWWKCDAPHFNTHTKRGGQCPGGKTHRLGDDFQFVPAEELGGAQVWFERLRREDPALLAEFVHTTDPIRPTLYQVESWIRQNLWREAEIASVRFYDILDDEMLDRYFPQNTANSNCIRPGDCPAKDFCWGGAAVESFEARRPNHLAERESFSAEGHPIEQGGE